MNVLPIDHKTICAVIYAILMALSLNSAAYADAQEDDYLKALESEAGDLKDFEPPAEVANGDADGNVTKAVDEVSPKEKEFAETLKAALPNTFLIYKKLSKGQKGLVVEAYFVNDRSMAEASRQIFNIYFKKIKTN